MASRAPSPRTRASSPPRAVRRSLVDAEGLRCEVRSMRSVPHALYSTPAVSHVVAAYVRQLINDFSRSLLLCRAAAAATSSSSSSAAGMPMLAATAEEEETYLLLRLCALHRAHASGDADGAAGTQQTNEKPGASSNARGDAHTRADNATSASSSSSSPRLTTVSVTEQLIALFAAAERARCARRRRSSFDTGPTTAKDDANDADTAAAGDVRTVMPPLLASLRRFKPMLQDMRVLATHLLLPRHAWQHHQREWVFVCEDVTVTLLDRLGRYRRHRARPSTSDGSAPDDEDPYDGGHHGAGGRDVRRTPVDAPSTSTCTSPSVFPLTELERLWCTLWEVLGAAWRQRDRLWGAYRHLHGARQLPPLCLSGSQAPYGVPPSVHAAPAVREQHARYIARVHASADAPAPPWTSAAAHAEDSCAFGPFTSADVGVAASRQYVLRHPLAAVLRTLRVAVPPAGRDALVTSTAAFAGFKYVEEPARRSTTSPAAAPTTSTTTPSSAPLVVPLFDTTDQDAALARAVPYLSPEVFLAAQQQQQQHRSCDASGKGGTPASTASRGPPVHAFSDDVWNAAVVALEAALSGFDVADVRVCHLAPPTAMSSADVGACSDVREAATVYAAVLHSLTHTHALPQAAAHNFLYAALYHFQLLAKSGGGGGGDAAHAGVYDGVDGDDSADDEARVRADADDDNSSVNSPWLRADSTVPADPNTNAAAANAIVLLSPARLAREWRRYVRRAYGPACLRTGGVVAELAGNGLSWRRSERWNAFGMAHVTRKAPPPQTTTCTRHTDAAAAAAAAYAPLQLPDNRATQLAHNPQQQQQQQQDRQGPPTFSSRETTSATGPCSGNGNVDGSSAVSSASSAASSRSVSPRRPRDDAAGPASASSASSPPALRLVEATADVNATPAAASYDRRPHPDMHVEVPRLPATGRRDAARTASAVRSDDGDAANAAADDDEASESDDAVDDDVHPNERSAVARATAVRALSALSLLPHSPYSLAANSPTFSASAVSSPLFHSARAGVVTEASAASGGGAAGSSRATSAMPLAVLPRRQERVFSALDAPLLRLFSIDPTVVIESHSGSHTDDVGQSDVWMRLASHLRRCTTTPAAVLAGGGASPALTSSSTFSGGGGGGGGSAVGKANGAVAEAADVDRVDELLRLLFRTLVLTTQRTVEAREGAADVKTMRKAAGAAAAAPHVDATRSSAASHDETTTAEWVPYAAINHPFFRGVVERGLLTTYMLAAGFTESDAAQVQRDDDDDGGGDGGVVRTTSPATASASTAVAAVAAAAPLPALSLFVPASTLLETIASIESAWRANAVALAAKGVDVCTERVVKQGSSLRTLIGDDMRAWEASAAARDGGGGGGVGGLRTRQQQQQQQQQQLLALMNPFVGMPTVMLPPAVHRARRALDSVVSPLEFDLALQLRHTQALRRRMLTRHNNNNAAMGAEADVRALTRGAAASTSAARLSAHLTASAAAAATRVRAYLQSTLLADARRPPATCSPLYPVPPTVRGEVWGCLLQVPAASRTREALLAHATHHTAAKPAPHDRQLSVDIPRCHAYHPLLSASSTGSAQLQRLLKAWLYLHPTYSYWQGLDSVCAVLLTVSERDEALVLAQLNAVVELFIAHDEDPDRARVAAGGGGAAGVGLAASSKQPRSNSSSSRIAAFGAAWAGSRQLVSTASARYSPIPPQPPQASLLRKPSMEEQLHRLTVLLRYCDPLLAHYLFDHLQCMPELYAISWLLTLFSHSLPTRKVYLLWDFLFTDGRIAAVVVLCAAVMMHKRERLLSTDFSGCLAAFSSGASALNVTAAVGDARHLIAALPPSVLTSSASSNPHTSAAAAGGAAGVGQWDGFDPVQPPMSNTSSADAAPVAAIASLHVSDLAAAFAAPTAAAGTSRSLSAGAIAAGAGAPDDGAGGGFSADAVTWFHSGVYLVDLRDVDARRPTREAVLGALHVPLSTQDASARGASDADSELTSPVAAALSAGIHSSSSSGGVGIADGAGWGIVEQQERRQERAQAAHDALSRRIADAAAAIVRAVGNSAMAALVPRVTADDGASSSSSGDGGRRVSASRTLPPWSVHPIVLKTACAPHVVLLTSGTADARELPVAHQLGVELSACGVHNVSVLAGGVASLRRALPELLVHRAPSV